MTANRDITAYALPDSKSACTTQSQHLSPVSCPHTSVLSLQSGDYEGYSDEWKNIVQQATLAAENNHTLIIAGEAGTGKASLAQAIHQHSNRKDKPLVFTDTRQDIALLAQVLEAASGGTLIVRHDGQAPASFIRGVERLYKTFTAPHTRLILCWKLPGKEALQTLSGSEQTLVIPPLRQRISDSVLLAEAFVARAAIWLERKGLTLSPEAKNDITLYSWPGNIRQLHTELFKAILHSPTNSVISPFYCIDIPSYATEGLLPSSRHGLAATVPSVPLMDGDGNLRSLDDIEAEIIQFALTHYQTSRSDIARMLGIGRTTLYRKVHQLHS